MRVGVEPEVTDAAPGHPEPSAATTVDRLARLAAVSLIPELRRAPAHQRRCFAALMLLCAKTRRGTARLGVARAGKSVLVGSRDLRRSRLIDFDALRVVVGAPGATPRAVLRAWLAAGLPGCPVVHVAALAPGLPPEEAFARFVLEDAWRGQFPAADGGEEIAPLRSGDPRAFLVGLASQAFATMLASHPNCDPRFAAGMARRIGANRLSDDPVDEWCLEAAWARLADDPPEIAWSLADAVTRAQADGRSIDPAVVIDYRRYFALDSPESAVEVAGRIAELQKSGLEIDLAMVVKARRAAPTREWNETIEIIESLLGLSAVGAPVDMGTLPVVLERFPSLTRAQIVDLIRGVCDLRAKGVETTATTFIVAQELFGDGTAALETLHANAQDLHRRLTTGPMADQVRKAAALEPLVNHPRRGPEQTVIPPRPLLERVAGFRRLAQDLGHRPAQSVVLVNRCGMSGAARVAASLAHALAAIDDKAEAQDVVVIRTEQSDLDYPDWFPDGCRHLDFAGRLIDTSPQGRRDTLREVLRSLEPEQIFNVNSRLMWDSTHALHRVLTDQSRLFTYLFCSDINDQGVEAGYPVEFFYRAISEYTGVIADSIALADTLRARFRLPPDHPRLHTLATPLIAPVAPVQFEGTPRDRRPRIFWAGRFDTQKRIDLLFEIAARMPHADFLVWGKPVLDTGLGTAHPPANVALQGTYAWFEDLPLGTCDAWLYTSAWDGVPTLLMDVAAAGIPLIGSLVGGTGEVMAEGLSERLDPGADAVAYVAALDRVLADLPGARTRAADLSARVTAERSFDYYRAGLRRIIYGAGDTNG